MRGTVARKLRNVVKDSFSDEPYMYKIAYKNIKRMYKNDRTILLNL